MSIIKEYFFDPFHIANWLWIEFLKSQSLKRIERLSSDSHGNARIIAREKGNYEMLDNIYASTSNNPKDR